MKHDKLTFKGLSHTKEWREMMSRKLKGRKFSKETLKKMGDAAQKRKLVGEKNPNWRGGIFLENFRGRFDTKGAFWKREVKKMGGGKCAMCKKLLGHICPHCEQKLMSYAHHIKSWKNYPELRYDLKNGILLCQKCHRLIANLANSANSRTDNAELNSEYTITDDGVAYSDKCVETIHETPSNGMMT